MLKGKGNMRFGQEWRLGWASVPPVGQGANRVLIRITGDGQLELGEGVSPSEGAAAMLDILRPQILAMFAKKADFFTDHGACSYCGKQIDLLD